MSENRGWMVLVAICVLVVIVVAVSLDAAIECMAYSPHEDWLVKWVDCT